MFARHSTLLLLTLAFGCNRAANLEEAAEKTQDKADEKIADVHAEATSEMRETRADANEKIAAIDENIAKMRDDYRKDTAMKLVTIDQKVTELEAKAARSVGTTKTDLDAKVSRIKTQRALFQRDYEALDRVTGATWDDSRARLNDELTELNRLVDAA